MKHVNKFILSVGINVFLLMNLPPAISQINPPIKTPNTQLRMYKGADSVTIAIIKKMARPLSPQENALLKNTLLPPAVDYSPFVTHVRDQDGTSSCCIQTTAAVIDILKERERSFTPDVSGGFINYAYQESIEEFTDDPRINIPGDGQAGVAKNLGVVSEAELSWRNYDPNNPYPPPTAAMIPTDRQIKIAPLLRIKDHKVVTFQKSDGLNPLKAFLSQGPLGTLYPVYTDDLNTDSHCMALIGYDDNKQVFTFQNSYGEQGPERGFVRWTYNDMLNRLDNMTFTIVTNQPTSPSAYVYTGRIKLLTPSGRDNLTIKVGVEGQQPFTIWGPAPYGAHDGSDALVLDFELPDYAIGHWPPSDVNPWYVEVSYPGQVSGTLKDIVLVKRGFRPDGTPLPAIYRPSALNIGISTDRTEKIYIPSRVSKQLFLSANETAFSVGQNVTFKGALLTQVAVASTRTSIIPMANQEVLIWEVHHDQIEGYVQDKLIGKTLTDDKGKYSVDYRPTKTAYYKAYASQKDGTFIAWSHIIKVTRHKRLKSNGKQNKEY